MMEYFCCASLAPVLITTPLLPPPLNEYQHPNLEEHQARGEQRYVPLLSPQPQPAADNHGKDDGDSKEHANDQNLRLRVE
jgi:hypothetical protein